MPTAARGALKAPWDNLDAGGPSHAPTSLLVAQPCSLYLGWTGACEIAL